MTTTRTSRRWPARSLDAQTIYDRIAVRDVQLAADVLAEVHRETHGRGRLRLARGRARHRSRRRADDRRGAHVLEGAVPAERDDQDPRHAGGRRRRSSRRSTRASTSTSRCCSPSRPTSAWPRRYLRGLERRQAEGLPLDVHSVASFFVSRVDTKVDPQLEQLGRSRSRRTAALANARAAYRRFQEIFSGPSLGRRCDTPGLRFSGRSGPRPASRTRPTPTRCTSTAWSAATRSTRCRWRPCTPWPTTVTSAGRRPSTIRRPISTRWGRRESTCSRSPTNCWSRACKQFEQAMDRLLAGIEERRVAVTTGRPPTIEGNLPPELAGAGRRARQAGGIRARRRTDLAARPIAVGRPGRAGDRESPRMADRGRHDAGACVRAQAVRPGGPGRGLHRLRAARDGWLLAGPGGDPALLRRAAERAALAGARLDPPRCRARCPGVGRHREDAVHRLLEIRWHDRDALALPPLQSAGRSAPVRRRHRSRTARSSSWPATRVCAGPS